MDADTPDPLGFAAPGADAYPLTLVTPESLEAWRASAPAADARWADAHRFAAGRGETLVFPDGAGGIRGALGGLGSAAVRRRGRFALAALRDRLPAGTWVITDWPEGVDPTESALGWALAGYRFSRYAEAKPPAAHLVAPGGVDTGRIAAMATAEAMTRDLINTPAEDMGPAELQAAVEALAAEFGAATDTTLGDALLSERLPLIHTVGRGAAEARAPRLVALAWGSHGPAVTLVGKGVCFDTGGLNLKPGSSMGLMKKDMGGAATVLGLAHMIMASRLPVRLRVLVPAVENAVSAPSFRPGDILRSRSGLTVEVNNTDAEGRLVLADALALADETPADLIISMATLTGAARVAVGPDLAPFYTDDAAFAAALAAAGERVADPVWRMPFHEPYEDMIEPGIADLDNAPAGGFAGSITAALFLRRFVKTSPYLHFDIYGWQPKPAPGRPKGGVGQGARALFDVLPEVLGL